MEINIADKINGYNTSGIYCIQNKINHKRYIGSCMESFRKRKNSHLFHLRNNTHHSAKLQNAFNKYGAESFTFSILEECEPSLCIEREQYWIDYYDSYNKGYNCSPTSGNCAGRILSEETKRKISNSLKGRIDHVYIREEKHRLQISERRSVPVISIDRTTNETMRFKSQTEAAKFFGTTQANVCTCCIKLNITAKNQFFRYEH